MAVAFLLGHTQRSGHTCTCDSFMSLFAFYTYYHHYFRNSYGRAVLVFDKYISCEEEVQGTMVCHEGVFRVRLYKKNIGKIRGHRQTEPLDILPRQ